MNSDLNAVVGTSGAGGMTDAMLRLEAAFGVEHPVFNRGEHQRELSSGDTRLEAYWEWTAHQVEADGMTVESAVWLAAVTEGDRIWWEDPDASSSSDWYTVRQIKSDSGRIDCSDVIVVLTTTSGSLSEVHPREMHKQSPWASLPEVPASRHAAAYRVLKSYFFGKDVVLDEMDDAWRRSASGDEWTMLVVVHTPGDDDGPTSESLSFNVRFAPNGPAVVEALAVDSAGTVWGHPSATRPIPLKRARSKDAETEAMVLRVKALGLLQQAEAVDALKPFVVVVTRGDETTACLAWNHNEPRRKEVEALLGGELGTCCGDRDLNESKVTLEEIAGVALNARIPDILDSFIS
ncbi:hypothetical protein BLA39750_01111 [Burkholderia lata]|uniref:Uncharacterized protein n=1 Tax=Burkholderia lata (strain ATCC 17760 / DSM 23089 / LMG 22485 / NCIMB 9086 / R18194 / 383) TaxID=482957 RepID=A0A6P2VAX0_BURL3|nr:hypothetical protein [Burkholderia lata]VWC79826.1 hypothetical protein BLA39750_01111 [Burkholderia lata]